MRETLLTSNPDFRVLLKKLGAEEHKPCLFIGDKEGWQTRLAWDPCETYTLKKDEKIGKDLYEFVENHRLSEHLIVGFLNYNLGNYLYGLQSPHKDEFDLPLISLFAYENYLEKKGDRTYARHEAPEFVSLVKNIYDRPEPPDGRLDAMTFQPERSKSSYLQAFERIKNRIYEGDVYQVNLTHNLRAEYNEDSRALFTALCQSNSAKMKVYLEAEGFEILSMSPERFIRSSSGAIETAPIKGTRPRGRNEEQDKLNEKNLLGSEKEKAELNMITDLLRNDLGKVCQPGSVKVWNQRKLEKLPAVMHTFSEIRGTLKSDISPFTALLSMFPGGSVTGCPKKKAMEIINELEDYDRGAYCGTIFYIDPDGEMDSNILIRTIVKKANRVMLAVGSGIVNDSKGAKEYRESMDKVKSVLSSFDQKFT